MASLSDRLRKNLKHLRKWARREGITCYRAYDHDIPEYPLILENYEGEWVGTLSSGRSEDEKARGAFVARVAEEIAAATQESRLTLKDRGIRAGGTRALGAMAEKLDPSRASVICEAGLRFEVNLHSQHDSGLFLDHRKTRAKIRELSRAQRVLNLFCYTGSFSVYAAAGGAHSVTSVDLSRTYLEWTERNFALNDLRGSHILLQEDVLQWLPRQQQLYDLIICDPPTFSNSKRMLQALDTVRQHSQFLQRCVQILAPSGQLFFSTNSSHFRLDPELVARGFVEISEATRSEDFRRGGGHRCWRYLHPHKGGS